MAGVYATASSRGVPPPLSQRDRRRTPPNRTGPHNRELTGRIGRHYARPAMPAPIDASTQRSGRVRDPDVPPRGHAAPRHPAVAAAPAKATLPRPATPPSHGPSRPRAGSIPRHCRCRACHGGVSSRPRASSSRACLRSASCARSARRRPRRIAPPSCAPRMPRSRPRSRSCSRT